MTVDPIPETKAQQEAEQATLTWAQERARRWEAWLALWKVAAALPCSARLLKSVQRTHQRRGVPQERHTLAPLEMLLHRRKAPHPVWPGYTPERRPKDSPLILIWRKPAAIGQAPRPAHRRLAQAGQSTVEFALILSLVAIVALVVASIIGPGLVGFFQYIYDTLGGI